MDMGRHVTSKFKCCLAVRCQWSFLVSSVTLAKYILRILVMYFLFLIICLSQINSYLILHTSQVRLWSNYPDPPVWCSCHQPQGRCPLCPLAGESQHTLPSFSSGSVLTSLSRLCYYLVARLPSRP